MIFNVENVKVYFPYDYVYPEQYAYMRELKRALDSNGHCILEMPTGTGKTVTLLSFITSYQLAHREVRKLIYCTRTVGELEKVLSELEVVIRYRDAQLEKAGKRDQAAAVLAVGLTTRRNLCLQSAVSKAESREEADSLCRSLTASWVRESHSAAIARFEKNPDLEDLPTTLCQFYEGYRREGNDAILPSGIYTLEKVLQIGRERGWCPYYTVRHTMNFANVIVYNYQYLLDPKIAGLISRELSRECIVVFDEAHNIDNVCIDALSVSLRLDDLRRAQANVVSLRNRIQEIRKHDERRLLEEYRRILQGIRRPADVDAFTIEASPVIPEDVLQETIPGNIRRGEHFLLFLLRLIDFFRQRMRSTQVTQDTPRNFLHALMPSVQILDSKPLRFCSDRLASLLQTLEISNVRDFVSLQKLAHFATLLGTYSQGFSVIMEPYDERAPNVPDPVLQLSCLDASIGMRPIFTRFQSVILTSGTISPLDLYARILGFRPAVAHSLNISLHRASICPMVIARGSDQIAISSKYDSRRDPSVIRNYGALLVELASIVPDGVVGFFTSYIYLESVVQMWHQMGIIQKLLEHKLVFIETPDIFESSVALENYRRACDSGRGAIFLCVARGKVAEGIDFDRHYGRCVVIIGVPFQYTESRVLRARLEFLREHLQIREGDFLTFDAMRQAAQCMGRVIRSKVDYGLMILADRRYNRAQNRSKLPLWIQSHLDEGKVDLSTDMALGIIQEFLIRMAQPLDRKEMIGTTLLREIDLQAPGDTSFSETASPIALMGSA
jgi:DNA excision repair protein ERCC-2